MHRCIVSVHGLGRPVHLLRPSRPVSAKRAFGKAFFIFFLLRSGALMQQFFSNVLLTGPPVSAFLQSDWARHWFKGKKVHYASVWEYLHGQHLQHHPEKLLYLTGHAAKLC